MKRLLIVMLAVVASISLSGCASLESTGQYGWILVGPSWVSGKSFDNEEIELTFTGIGSTIKFQLVNVSTSAIKILWDKCAYTDLYGSTHPIVPAGVKYIDAYNNEPTPATIIPSKKDHYSTVLSRDNITYNATTNEWYHSSMLPNYWTESSKGKTFSFTLCYEIDNNERLIQFDFLIGIVGYKLQTSDASLNRFEFTDGSTITDKGAYFEIVSPLPSSAGISSVFEPMEP